ncbi:STAS domain-containing protein [Sutcliffiella rhizosphaerae]|nr:STAS domain-containing protein [Sutcliffiella rhizosphaerae]
MFENIQVIKLLDSIGESLIFADKELYITWFNKPAQDLLQLIGPYVGIQQPEEFIGKSLSQFHGQKQHDILMGEVFPHSANIKLFNRFSARIVVDRVLNNDGEFTGFVLTWKDVTDYQKELSSHREMLKSLYTPIIETALESAILVALTGNLTEERIQYSKDAILVACGEKKAEYIIFDFTGIAKDIDDMVAFHLDQLADALKLMGSEAIFVGLNPIIIQNMIEKGLNIRVKTFQSFRQGIAYVWEKKGYELVKK